METRAYLTPESGNRLRLDIRENCTLYSKGAEVFWVTFPFVDDGKDHIMGSQPEQPFTDADRVLAGHGWKREGRWVIGDVVTGTYARIIRA